MARPFVLAMLAAIALAACTAPTPYRPAADGEGYAERRIEDNRYRVEFAGNPSTPRHTVEDYLLYRAAEITLRQGKDHFVVAARSTDADTTYWSSFDDFPTYGFYRPWYAPGYPRWYSFSGYDSPRTYRPSTRYRAHAEIVLFSGRKPADDVNAFDARAVIARLGPTIKRPERGPLP
jgi:hypothetical protein